MVQVGGRNFPYTRQGNKDAKAYAKRTGQTVRRKRSKPVKRKRGK